MMITQSTHKLCMEAAIEEMKKSDHRIKVGAVIAIDGHIVARGSRTKTTHAERSAIQQALNDGVDLKRATLYTTLEPCVEQRPAQKVQSCADFIISSGLQEVFIGRYDPNPIINRHGWKRLRHAGLYLHDFHDDFRKEIDVINESFHDFFKKGLGLTGGAKINHMNKGFFEIQFSEDDDRTMTIVWTVAGIDCAYGYAVKPVEVALARFATHFDDVDDPTAYDFSHSVRIGVNEIGIFKGPDACILVKPKEIESGPNYNKQNFFVSFDYQVRVRNPRLI